MTRRTLLLVDDDETLRELLTDYLETVGYRVVAVADGEQGLRAAGAADVDLVLLDVMMPGLDGWSVCERLRRTSTLPVILLTARGMELDKLRGFRLGADDYVTKPFSFAELAARVAAVLARADPRRARAEVVRSGELEIKLDDRAVTIGGRPVELTPAEFRLVETLARRLHRPVAAEQLRSAVQDGRGGPAGDSVKHLVWAVRRKLEPDPAEPRHLRTVRGFGYRLD